jgi:hypothetical protein
LKKEKIFAEDLEARIERITFQWGWNFPIYRRGVEITEDYNIGESRCAML